MLEHSRDAEIAQLDDVRACQEYILALDVSVQDLAVVHMLQTEADLSEPVQDLRFSEEAAALRLDHLLEIAPVRVVHHDTELPLLCLVDLPESNDIRVIEHLQYFCLLQRVGALTLAHLSYVDLLNDGQLLRALALDEEGLAEGALSKQVDLLVYFKVFLLMLLSGSICADARSGINHFKFVVIIISR